MKDSGRGMDPFTLARIFEPFFTTRPTGNGLGLSTARAIVRELFSAFIHEPKLLPPDYRREDDAAQGRAVADYIAGMTDRYAIREHAQLFKMGEHF